MWALRIIKQMNVTAHDCPRCGGKNVERHGPADTADFACFGCGHRWNEWQRREQERHAEEVAVEKRLDELDRKWRKGQEAKGRRGKAK